MKVLFYSSINIDYTYHVDHIVKEGETISSSDLTIGAGGKGANQCAAFAKAFGKDSPFKVFLGGKCGKDGNFILEKLNGLGVDTSFMVKSEIPTGNAIIQLDKNGQNSIVLFGGGNRAIEKEEIENTLKAFSKDDMLCVNCEINNLDYVIERAWEKGMKIVLNPSPVNDVLNSIDINKVTALILNEPEARLLTDADCYENMMAALCDKYGLEEVVLTAGEDGAYCRVDGENFFVNAEKVKVADTVGAGDTFMGYYFSSRIKGLSAKESLEIASKAASIAVSRPGAMDSIPFFEEI